MSGVGLSRGVVIRDVYYWIYKMSLFHIHTIWFHCNLVHLDIVFLWTRNEQNVDLAQVVPAQDQASIHVYVRFGARPTAQLHEQSMRVPKPPSCRAAAGADQPSCDADPYSFAIGGAITKRRGTVFVGLLFGAEKLRRREKRSCAEGRRHKRSCVEPKEAPRPENVTIIPEYDPAADLNYTISMQENKCLFWDEGREKWVSTGCRAALNSTANLIQCACNHLSSFGGGLLVAPNPIDFDVVILELSRLGETGNVAVLCTIITALLLYLLIVVFARRADKQDEKKVGSFFMLSFFVAEYCLLFSGFGVRIFVRYPVNDPENRKRTRQRRQKFGHGIHAKGNFTMVAKRTMITTTAKKY